MPVKVRAATRKDAESIAKFAIILSEQHRDYDDQRFIAFSDIDGAKRFYGGRTEAAGAAILIAEVDGQPVGFAYLEYEAKNYADLLENAAWLHDIYVDKAARGTGVGKTLIDEAAKAAKQLGADKLMLHVAARNLIGQDFFERAGFRTTMLEMMLKIDD